MLGVSCMTETWWYYLIIHDLTCAHVFKENAWPCAWGSSLRHKVIGTCTRTLQVWGPLKLMYELCFKSTRWLKCADTCGWTWKAGTRIKSWTKCITCVITQVSTHPFAWINFQFDPSEKTDGRKHRFHPDPLVICSSCPNIVKPTNLTSPVLDYTNWLRTWCRGLLEKQQHLEPQHPQDAQNTTYKHKPQLRFASNCLMIAYRDEPIVESKYSGNA